VNLIKDNAKNLVFIEQKDLFTSECQSDLPFLNTNEKGKNVFKCKFCSKSYMREHFFKKHEKNCEKN
jgi:hypothetical protein